MCLLVRRCLNRSHLVQELYETWQLDHKEAMLSHDAGELCGEWLDLARLCKHVWDGLLEALFDNKIGDTEKTGEAFRGAVKRSIHVGRMIQDCVSDATRKGYTIRGSAELANWLRDTEVLENDIAEKWPFISNHRMAQARAAYGRGEHQGIEDILHATHGKSSRTH